MRKEIDKFVEQRLVSVVPSKRQIAHQRREFYGFVHFTVNTFTGKEWGDGTEDEAIFNPVKMDADQWCDHVIYYSTFCGQSFYGFNDADCSDLVMATP